MLREKTRRWLLDAAINGQRPVIMTPEETKTYESMYARIRKGRAEGHSYVYEIPTELPERGMNHDLLRLSPEFGTAESLLSRNRL